MYYELVTTIKTLTSIVIEEILASITNLKGGCSEVGSVFSATSQVKGWEEMALSCTRGGLD